MFIDNFTVTVDMEFLFLLCFHALQMKRVRFLIEMIVVLGGKK